jgi:hypothetical protein
MWTMASWMQCLSILTTTLILFINNISPFCNGSWLLSFPFCSIMILHFVTLLVLCYLGVVMHSLVSLCLAALLLKGIDVRLWNLATIVPYTLWHYDSNVIAHFLVFLCFVTLLIRNAIVHLQSSTNVSVISKSLCLFSNFCVCIA